jgi:hypothetical protein
MGNEWLLFDFARLVHRQEGPLYPPSEKNSEEPIPARSLCPLGASDESGLKVRAVLDSPSIVDPVLNRLVKDAPAFIASHGADCTTGATAWVELSPRGFP